MRPEEASRLRGPLRLRSRSSGPPANQRPRWQSRLFDSTLTREPTPSPSCCSSTPESARPRLSMREKDLGIWQSWTWAEAAEQVRALRLRSGGDGLQARRQSRDHRRQPPAALLGHGGCAVPGRRAGSACIRTRWRPRWPTSWTMRTRASRWSRTRSRWTSCSRSARGCPSSSRSSTKIRAACATTTSRSCASMRTCSRRGGDSTQRILSSSCARWARAAATTSPSCSTPPARPASRRVCVRRMQRSIAAARGGCEFDKLGPGDEILSYLPMAWVGDNLFSYAQAHGRRLYHQLPRVQRYGDDRYARDRSRPTISRRRACSRTC